MRISANHAHVFPKQRRENGDVATLLKRMDLCGIEDCVTFAPFHAFFDHFTDSPNRWMAQEIQAEKRLIGFGVIDFDSDDILGQLHEIEDLGFPGIKLHPAFQHFAVMDDKARQVYEEAQKAKLFLSFHTGVHWDRIANYQVLLFDEVAYHYPALRFSMEHIGGYSFFREALAVLTNNGRDKAHPHVYGGLTSVFDKEKNRLWHLTQDEVMEAVLQAGDDALLFGLDFPYNSTEQTKTDIESILALPIEQASKEKLLGGNLRALLNIP